MAVSFNLSEKVINEACKERQATLSKLAFCYNCLTLKKVDDKLTFTCTS